MPKDSKPIDLSQIDPDLLAAIEAKVRADIAAAGGEKRWEGSTKTARKKEMKRIAKAPRPGRLKNLLDQPGRCACGRYTQAKAYRQSRQYKGEHCLIADPKAAGGKRPCTLADRPKFE